MYVCYVLAPDGSMLPVSIQKSSTSAYAEFTPVQKGNQDENWGCETSGKRSGDHMVEIYLDHEIIDEFVIKIKDEKHSLPPVCLAGQKYSFDGKKQKIFLIFLVLSVFSGL